jgi:hypothetical protein
MFEVRDARAICPLPWYHYSHRRSRSTEFSPKIIEISRTDRSRSYGRLGGCEVSNLHANGAVFAMKVANYIIVTGARIRPWYADRGMATGSWSQLMAAVSLPSLRITS